MSLKVSARTKFRKAKSIQWKDVEGEAVLFHAKSGDFFALDAVGTSIWKQLAKKPKTLDDLIDTLSLEYAGDLSQMRRDVLALCSQLVAEKLLLMED
jgi:hypothetical protein